MKENDLVNIVKGMYEAFGRGDIQGVLARLADDVEWYTPGPRTIPYAGPCHGLKEVMGFFEALGRAVEFAEFTPEEFYVRDKTVVVLGRERARVKATGREILNDWTMVFRFRDDKVISYRSYDDTAAVEKGFTS